MMILRILKKRKMKKKRKRKRMEKMELKITTGNHLRKRMMMTRLVNHKLQSEMVSQTIKVTLKTLIENSRNF
jgi:hypothetical protein